MLPNAANTLVSSMLNLQSPTVDEIMRAAKINVGSLSEISEEPDQTVAMAANVVAAAISGEEACLDFYQISSFAKANTFSRENSSASRKINIDPVVRIELPTSLLAALVEKLKTVSGNLPQ